MEYMEQTLTPYDNNLTAACGFLPCPVEQACFFDMETTGLSPKVSSLYLLGAAFFQDNKWKLIQWFADDYISEKDILLGFGEFLKPFDTIIHYNGATFDVPYLEKKYKSYHIPSPFQKKHSIDLYRQLSHKKNLFSISNEKLTTMERLFGFERRDCYTGKDCIQLYTDFMQAKYAKDNKALSLKNSLLTHNHDDLTGTIMCSNLLYYKKHSPTCASFSKDDGFVTITEELSAPAPVRLNYESDLFALCFDKTSVTVKIPLYEGTLYHYFDDYKNYYYLPEEDTAIHKSVGSYVDPAFRKKATASNCYMKKTGIFLPLPCDFETTQVLFQESKRSSKRYLFLDSKTILTNEECCSYLKNCICKL